MTPLMRSFRPFTFSSHSSLTSDDGERTSSSSSPYEAAAAQHQQLGYSQLSMKPSDQGGCVLAMLTGIPMYPTKTDHIMSRYRPIAPKPAAKPEGTDQTDSHSLSSLSAEKSITKLSSEYRGKRPRKRAPDSKSPRPGKRTRPGMTGGGGGSTSGKSSGTGIGTGGNVEFQTPYPNLTPIFSDRVAPIFGPGGLQRFRESFDHSQQQQQEEQNELVSVSLSLASKSPPRDAYFGQVGMVNGTGTMLSSKDGLSLNIGNGNHSGNHHNHHNGNYNHNHHGGNHSHSHNHNHEELLEKDGGFMERAAASGTPVLFTAEPSNLHSVRKDFSFACTSISTSFGGDSEVCSAEDAAESGRPNLVTLSLLPNTPLHVHTHSMSSGSTLSLFSSDVKPAAAANKVPEPSSNCKPNTNLTMSSSGRSWHEEGDISLLLRGAGEGGGAATTTESGFGPVAVREFVEKVSGMSSSHSNCRGRVIDVQYLEQLHGTSSEAVMLTDELDRVLWANAAFKRASSERTSGRMQEIGPHIDPLGIRTQLATLSFQPPFPAPQCKAVLSGFLKKFIFHEGGNHSNPSNNNNNNHLLDGPQAKVIAPQAVRPVGSTITLQTVVCSDPHAAAQTESFESVQERLERGDMPSVITDSRDRVRWVNSAYKRMVGQPKCSWLASTVNNGCGGDEELLAQVRLAGDVSLICDGAQLPAEAGVFQCRVRIQWSHQGEHSAMSVPAGVVRIDDSTPGGSSLYVWAFDVCDAGVKNLLQIEDTRPFC